MPWREFIAAAVALTLYGTPASGQFAPGAAHDTKQPIEITSDTLEVQKDQQIAIFEGNVDAAQGELNLRSDRLIVHYRTNENGDSTISLIEAEGNVFLASPTEMGQSERGIYNVDTGMVELLGSVVLTRGQNVIRGNRLVLNLATGKSKMESGVSATGQRKRVKALFVPNSKPQ